MEWFNFDKLAPRKVWEDWINQIFHTKDITVMKWSGKKGFKFVDDGHPSEQLTIVLEGQFKFFVGSETKILNKWDSVLVSPMEKHGGEAITDIVGIDIFFPKRQESRYN